MIDVMNQEVHFRLIKLRFNAYNILAVYGAAICLEGEDKNEILLHLSSMTGAKRRFEYYISPKEKSNRY